MSSTTSDVVDEADDYDDAVDRVREHREAFEYLAETDLPIARYCQNALDALEEADSNE